MSEPELNVDIPNEAGWPIQSVDSLCSLISRGTAPVYVEHSEVLAIGQRCITSTEFAPDFARPHSHRAMRNVLRPEFGDVLLNSTGTGTIGRSVVFDSPGAFVVDGHVTVMRPRAELADSRWLNSVLRTPALQRHLERFCFAGSTNQLELSRTPLRVSRLPTPHIDDQRAIGLVIDTLDTAIQTTEAIIAKLKAVKQGLLHDLLTRGIDANGELRPPQSEAPHLYKSSPLGWIPKEWELSSVGEQFEIQLGKMLDVQKNAGVLKPYLGNKAVQWDRIDLREVQQVRLSKSDLIRFRLQKGDLLVCEGGEAGRAAIWDNDLDECYYQKALHRLRPVGDYHPRLMLEILRYLIGRDALSEYISRTSIAHLTQEKLATVPLPTPKSDEQEQMVAEILTAKQRIETEESQLQKLNLLKSALMDDLLTGRVRVTPLLETAAP